MKNVFFIVLIGAALTGCANQQGTGVGQQLAATWLNNECHRYIEGQQIWQLGKIALGNDADFYKKQVCQCASQEAAKNMNTEQMIGLANERKRPQILLEMIAPTVVVCYRELKGLF
ncbi:hypothetical protein [Suttonella indologenes]|uniref:Lipoprotein n=1 Tax=Suttonella indologenes TaxID=13276 RepID=A0A380N233_9GAMM|nr:hypothetical protein [Suttonella indologenes]SUO98578.1 Uncharacterised protein [Suttonella indologenes]